METGLRGKTVLVTGGSRGIGFAVAQAFHLEGAEVVICSRNPKHLVAAAKKIGEIAAYPCDVRKPADIARMLRRLGRLDVLVNNAGGMEHYGADATAAQWRSTFELNLFGAVEVTRAARPLLERTGGCVINMASEVGRQPFDMGPDYCAAKAALLSYTKYLATQLAPRVRVNAICPGPIVTDTWYEANGRNRKRYEEDLRKSAARVPMGRVGRPEEVAAVALLLASPLASFITGTAVGVDGGAVKGIA